MTHTIERTGQAGQYAWEWRLLDPRGGTIAHGFADSRQRAEDWVNYRAHGIGFASMSTRES